MPFQKQLQRLGCSPGRPDGSWGRNSRRALERFAKHSGSTLASLDPSPDVFELLKRQKARTCPVVCRRGEVLSRNGTCVAKVKPDRKAKPTPDRKREKKRERTRKQPPKKAPRKKKASSGGGCGFCLSRRGNIWKYCGARYQSLKSRGMCN